MQTAVIGWDSYLRGVGVLNLTRLNNGLAQDQLVYENFGVGKVPEPIAMLFYGVGFAGAGLYRRMRRKIQK